MFHLQTIAAFIILSTCLCQTEAGGQRASSYTGKVTLQPWLVGLTAVVVFLFIVFVLLVIQRLFLKKNKDRNEENVDKLAFYDNPDDVELNEETKQTTF